MNKIDEERLLTLVEGIKAGEENAFKEFFFIMQPYIYYYIFRLISDKEAAEDLTQETFIKFWLCSERLDTNLSSKAYLYKIARNLTINYINRKPRVSYINEEKNILVMLSNADKEIESVFFIDDYQRAISTLPQRCRETFLLSRFGGFEYSEIAEIMNVSIQTVKNQMNKAISVLKTLLAAHLN
jgi:RNA polymerase sigma-70 factor (ECF subfamily)